MPPSSGVVTKNGKAAAVLLAVKDDDELKRLVLAHSPKFQASLDRLSPTDRRVRRRSSRRVLGRRGRRAAKEATKDLEALIAESSSNMECRRHHAPAGVFMRNSLYCTYTAARTAKTTAETAKAAADPPAVGTGSGGSGIPHTSASTPSHWKHITRKW
jgi:hypothetical protein